MKRQLVHQRCEQLWGKVRGKTVENCGEVQKVKLSPICLSFPQSYPQGFQPRYQTLIPQSTDPTTATMYLDI